MAPTCSVHWLTHTTSCEVERVLDVLGGGHSDVEFRGGYGHPMRFIHETGAEVYFGSKREDQPVCINAPGEVCETASKEILTAAVELGANTTRYDLATDLEPPEKARRRIREMHRAWVRGQVETNIDRRSHQMHQDDREGQGVTAVFGGRTSGFLMRAYDRRGPLRIECEQHPKDGTVKAVVAGLLLERGPAPMWRSLARCLPFPMGWYQELLAGPAVEWERAKEEETSLWSCLEAMRGQLGPTLWMLMTLGVKLADLAVEPERPKGELMRKGWRWAREAEELGLDGVALKKALDEKARGRRIAR